MGRESWENPPVDPCREFSGALLEWCSGRGLLRSPRFYGISKDDTFVVMKGWRHHAWWLGLGLNFRGLWRLFTHCEDLDIYPLRDMVYEVYLSRRDLRVYLGEHTYMGAWQGAQGPFNHMACAVWEWRDLGVDLYSPDCFSEIWKTLE